MRARISVKQPGILAIVAIVAAVGLLSVLVLAQTAFPSFKFEAESGSALASASVASDATASGGSLLTDDNT